MKPGQKLKQFTHAKLGINYTIITEEFKKN